MAWVAVCQEESFGEAGEAPLRCAPSREPGESASLYPEELLAWLAGQPAEETTGTVGGYKVKVRYKAPEDARSKRVAEILARSVGRLGRDDVKLGQ